MNLVQTQTAGFIEYHKIETLFERSKEDFQYRQPHRRRRVGTVKLAKSGVRRA